MATVQRKVYKRVVLRPKPAPVLRFLPPLPCKVDLDLPSELVSLVGDYLDIDGKRTLKLPPRPLGSIPDLLANVPHVREYGGVALMLPAREEDIEPGFYLLIGSRSGVRFVHFETAYRVIVWRCDDYGIWVCFDSQ